MKVAASIMEIEPDLFHALLSVLQDDAADGPALTRLCQFSTRTEALAWVILQAMGREIVWEV